jgi:undecaprenyl-diphosphatase
VIEEMAALRQAGRELVVLDQAVYEAVHATPTPALDHAVARISRAADHSKIWLSSAAVLAVAGRRPRGAALVGLAAVGISSAVVNIGVKPLVRRERPERLETVRTHVVRMPTSASYPSGHAASAFAFSTAVGGGLPELDVVLRLAATTVAYSRVHTGVHFPGDVIAGGGIGAAIGVLTLHLARRAGLATC